MVADRHRPGRGGPRQLRRLRCGIAAYSGVGMSRRCSVVAGPSRVAAGPPRRRRDGPTQRSDNRGLCRRLVLRSGNTERGASGPMTPRCARARRRCRPPRRPQRSRTGLGQVRVGYRAAESGRRSRPAPGAGAHGAAPRVLARARSLHGPCRRVVGRRGEGQARRPRCCDTGDAQGCGRAASGEAAAGGVWGTGVLVQTLLERGAEGDLVEAQEAIGWLANLSADDGSAMVKITLLRLRALLARARGDDVAYRDFVIRYRAMAESLGFEGHTAGPRR